MLLELALEINLLIKAHKYIMYIKSNSNYEKGIIYFFCFLYLMLCLVSFDLQVNFGWMTAREIRIRLTEFGLMLITGKVKTSGA